VQAQLRRLPDAGLGLHAAGPDLLAYPVDGALAVPVHRAHEALGGLAVLLPQLRIGRVRPG
jgi:hypothetical protein